MSTLSKKIFLNTGAIAVFVVMVAAALWFTHTSTPIAEAAKNCKNNADVAIGIGGLGTRMIKCLSDGVCAYTKATPNSKLFGCAMVGCRDQISTMTNYVKQQCAGKSTCTVDIVGHSAGADGAATLANNISKFSNVKIRRVTMADPTPFAKSLPAGIGQVNSLVSSWEYGTCMKSASPTKYVMRGDLNHMQIDNLIPENMPCIDDEIEQKCVTGNEEDCRNKCSTSYTDITEAKAILLIKDSNNAGVAVTDCYDKNSKQEGAAKKLIKELQVCVNKAEVTEDKLKKALCITEKEVKTDKKTGTITITDEKEKKMDIPKACVGIVTKIEKLKKGEGAETETTKGEAEACAWKGAVTCFPDSDPTKKGKFKCIKKADGTADQSDLKKPPANNNNALNQCRQKKSQTPPTSIGGSPSGPSSSPSSSSAPPREQLKCAEGEKKGLKEGKLACVKDPSQVEVTTVPQCLFIANKEEVKAGEPVVLQWRTVNAEKVTISGVETKVEKSGRTTVNPTKPTTYKLVATGKVGTGKKGKGKKNEKICEVKVEITGASEFDGENQPLLGCSSELIAKGATAEILWSCASGADSISSRGFETNKQLKGRAVVRPDHNTQYEVSCSTKGKVVGKNVCSVRVGDPQLSVLVYPKSVKEGERVRVSWASLFMKSCRVQGPRGFDYDRPQGVVITAPFTKGGTQPNVKSTKYRVVCQSEFGGTFSKDIVVGLSR